MRRILVIVFDNETRADQGQTELLKMDSEGSIGIYGYTVVAKNADRTVVVKQADGHGTLTPFAKTSFGSLSSPTGPAPWAAASQGSDSAANSNTAKTGKDFIDDVTEVLLPNRLAIVVEAEEEWPTLLDTRMDSLGGTVFRWTVSEVQHAVDM